MDILLHFIITLAFFSLLGYKKKAITLAMISVLPDFDVLIGIHKSISHSIIVLGLVSIPFLLYFWRYKTDYFNNVFLVLSSLILHIIFDTFYGDTPILWPILSNRLIFHFDVLADLRNGLTILPKIGFSSKCSLNTSFTGIKTPITLIQGFQIFSYGIYPLATSEGTIIFLTLLSAIIYKIKIIDAGK